MLIMLLLHRMCLLSLRSSSTMRRSDQWIRLSLSLVLRFTGLYHTFVLLLLVLDIILILLLLLLLPQARCCAILSSRSKGQARSAQSARRCLMLPAAPITGLRLLWVVCHDPAASGYDAAGLMLLLLVEN